MCSSSPLKRVEEMTSIFFFMTLMRSTCLGKQNKATIGEFPEHNLITVSNKVKMPYSNLFPSPSGVTIGHFGEAPGRKYDPAALVLCAALSLRDPLCDSQDLSSLLPFNSKYLFVSIGRGCFSCEQKPSRFLLFLQMRFGEKLVWGVLTLARICRQLE